MKTEKTNTPHVSIKRIVRRFFILVTIAIVVAFALVILFQRLLIFPRYVVPDYVLLQGAPADAEVHWLDEQIEYWFLPSFESAEHAPAVFFAHGNGAVIDQYSTSLNFYRKMGYHVVLIEYRGYGRSKGSPGETGIVEDYVAVYDKIVERSDVDPDHIVFHGQSIGGGIVSAVARERQPDKLVLESTFTSIRSVVHNRMPGLGWFVFDPLDTADFLQASDLPVLIFHGTADGIVPYEHGKALAKIAKRSTFITTDDGHAVARDGRYLRTLKKFLAD